MAGAASGRLSGPPSLGHLGAAINGNGGAVDVDMPSKRQLASADFQRNMFARL